MRLLKWLALAGAEKAWLGVSGSARAVLRFIVAMKPVEPVQGMQD